MFESNLTLHANVVPDKTDTPQLCIHGTVVIDKDGEQIEVEKTSTQNGNPNILRLNLNERMTQNQTRGTLQPFTYTEKGSHVTDYEQITVRFGKRIVCFQYNHHSSRQLSEV